LTAEGSPEVASTFTSSGEVWLVTSALFTRKRTRVALAASAAVVMVGAGTAVAQGAGWRSASSHDFGAAPDSFSGHGTVTGNVLRNDFGATAVVRHTSLAVGPDGTWTVHQKVLPATGQPDSGEILAVDITKLPAVLKTVTVTIHVR
jgi:hypothetical protein